jgi:hypothetical protein
LKRSELDRRDNSKDSAVTAERGYRGLEEGKFRTRRKADRKMDLDVSPDH